MATLKVERYENGIEGRLSVHDGEIGFWVDMESGVPRGVANLLRFHRHNFPDCDCCADLEARYLTPEPA